jgi:hypothetical protein
VTNHNLTDTQKDQLLAFFAFNLSMEMRGRLMVELPMAYNAWCGREVVRVLHVNLAEPLVVPLNRCEAQRGQEPWHFQAPKRVTP